jgi:antitoxin VapB
MSLNIKNQEAYRLASELAELTGETLTKAVTEALRERLERLKKHRQKATAEELLEIGRRCAARFTKPVSSLDHGDWLYDEHGLPK